MLITIAVTNTQLMGLLSANELADPILHLSVRHSTLHHTDASERLRTRTGLHHK